MKAPAGADTTWSLAGDRVSWHTAGTAQGGLAWLDDHRLLLAIHPPAGSLTTFELVDFSARRAQSLFQADSDGQFDLAAGGSFLVYIANERDGQELRKLELVDRPDGVPGIGRQSVLLRGTSGFFQARLSPDGRRVALASGDGLYLMAADGSNRRLLVKANARDTARVSLPRYLDWSPDGRFLAYSLGLWEGSESVYRLDVSSGSVVRLTRLTETVAPSWSPDGKYVLFQVTPYGLTQSTPWLVRSGGGGEQRILERVFEMTGGAWLSASDLILVGTGGNESQFYRVRVGAGRAAPLWREPGGVATLAVHPARPGATGGAGWLAYVTLSGESGPASRLTVVPVAGLRP